jgi:HAD superfamily hydrolase (TIGR01459 family)
MADMTGALAGLSAIASRYDGILSDVWGVLHDGVTAHAEAADALASYRARGGRVVLVTNAPRPSAPILAMLDDMGVRRDAYDGIVSSGDASRKLIAPYSGRIIHHVGPPHLDDDLYEGLGVVRGPAEIAEAVVVTDLDDDDDLPEIYSDRMALWLRRDLPLICANPDKVVEMGGRLIYCGGALADLYAARGGRVLMAGKPYRAIYNVAMARLEAAAGRPMRRDRVLAIGDAVRTDAAGAAGFGIDFLFISGSVHAAELGPLDAPDPARVHALVDPSGVTLVGYQPRLTW